MWRLIQSVSRTTRGFWNATTRPAQQTLYHDDDQDLKKNKGVKGITPSIPQVVKPFGFSVLRSTNICKHEDQTEDKERQDWYKNQNFYHNFWYYEFQHCQFLEAVGLGTALLLGCKLSQLCKLKAIHEKRKSQYKQETFNPTSSFAFKFYTLAFGEHSLCSSTCIFTVLPSKQKEKGLSNLNSCSKSCKQVEFVPAAGSDYSRNDKTKVEFVPAAGSDYSRNDRTKHTQESWVAPASEINADEILHLQNDSNLTSNNKKSNNSSKNTIEEKEVNLLDEFTKEWDDLCMLYDGIHFNREGLKFAKIRKYKDALISWENAGKMGSSDGYFNIGLCYETGQGVKEDVRKASEYYKKASDSGNAAAAHNLALMYLNNTCPPPDNNSGIALLEQASKCGLAEAQTELGILYSKRGDMKSAVDMFELAAKQNDSWSEYFLGLSYEHGWGVTQNSCKAADWYSKASKAEHPEAIFKLASFFQHGLGGLPENHAEAFKLYKKCADMGHFTARQYMEEMNSPRGDSGFNLNREMKISQSEPALSTYIRQHITDHGDIKWPDLLLDNSTLITKSSTVNNFNTDDVKNCSVCNGENSFFSIQPPKNGNITELLEYKKVKFVLGDGESEDSVSGVSVQSGSSDGSDLFTLEGTFGEITSIPKHKGVGKAGKFDAIHRSPSFDRLSNCSIESDDSDVSIMFDDNFQGYKISRLQSEEPNAGINMSRHRSSGFVNLNEIQDEFHSLGNKFTGFDLFGSSGVMPDELSDLSAESSCSSVYSASDSEETFHDRQMVVAFN